MSGTGIRFPTLTKAPIVEAVVHFTVTPPLAGELAPLQAVQTKIAGDYPNKTGDAFDGVIAFEVGAAHSSAGNPVGFRYASADGKYVVQLLRDAFGFSRLEPYQNWGKMRDEALRLWKVYREVCGPKEISRIGVRYINRLLLPTPLRDVCDYLTAGIQLPPRLPQAFISCLTRYLVRDAPSGAFALVTQSHEPPRDPSPSVLSFLLDIDVFFTEKISAVDDGAIGVRLEALRELKNRLFFESVTEAAIELWR